MRDRESAQMQARRFYSAKFPRLGRITSEAMESATGTKCCVS